ncbi:hypothetical protein ACFU8W_45455 [Streptomyces sp. NPDC057565]|uniref:hypothetical protein n=1 Tax=Streptomyces sp. NPDC057565 TaxID=3346169 RepID=UPI003692751C
MIAALDPTQHHAPGPHIDAPGMITVDEHAQVADFRTGEVNSSWIDQYGRAATRMKVCPESSVPPVLRIAGSNLLTER